MILKKQIKNQPCSLLGLDIGLDTIRAVELSHTSSTTKLVAYGTAQTAQSIFVGDNLANIEQLTQAISHLLTHPQYGQFDAQDVHVSLPSEISIRAGQLHLITSQISNLLNDIGLKLYEIDTHSLVLQRACLPAGDTRIASIIEFGSSTTGHIYGFASQPVHTYEFRTNQVVDAISQKLGLSSASSEVLLFKIGIAGNELGGKVRGILKPQLNNFVYEIDTNLSHYIHTLAEPLGRALGTIVLTGKFATVPGLTEYLNSQLKYALEVANPWQNMSLYPLKPMPRHRNSEYATAIGLAMV